MTKAMQGNCRTWRCFLTTILVALMAACSIMVAGCRHGQPPKPLSVVVLLDETSFATKHWEDSLKVAQLVAGNMGSNDRFEIDAIDDCSGEDADVLVGPEVLPAAAVFAKGAASKLVREIKTLERRRPAGKGTDIIGALREAANTFERNSATPQGCKFPKYVPLIVVCSDMRSDLQDPVAVYQADRFDFPPGTRIRCFFVSKETEETEAERKRTGGKSLSVSRSPDVQWRELVKWWTTFLGQVGLTVSEQDFKKVAESKMDTRGNAANLKRLLSDARYSGSGH